MKPGAAGYVVRAGVVTTVAALAFACFFPGVALAADWSVRTLPGESVEVTGPVSIEGTPVVRITGPVTLSASSSSEIASAIASSVPTSTALVLSSDDESVMQGLFWSEHIVLFLLALLAGYQLSKGR